MALGLHFIEAQDYYERDFILELDKSRGDLDLVPAEDAIPHIVAPAENATAATRMLEVYKSIGVRAQLCKFEPTSVSAIIALSDESEGRFEKLDPKDPEALERIIGALSGGRTRVNQRPYNLILNEDNLLIQKVLEQLATRGGDALSTQVLKQIYYSAVLVFGDRDFSTIAEIVPSIAGVMTSFFGHLGESDRELQRVRKIAEEDRQKLQSVSERLALYEPPDSKTRSIFLAYSFDSNTRQLLEPFRMMLRAKNIEIIDGQADEVSSLSNQVVQKIRTAAMFVGVLTRRGAADSEGRYQSSMWVIEEKGAAISLGKPVLILAEASIRDDYLAKLSGDNVWLSTDGSTNEWFSCFTKAVEMIERALAAASEPE